MTTKLAQKAIEDLKARDVLGIEAAIHFLKAEVIEFRSGNLKEYLWRYRPRVALTEPQLSGTGLESVKMRSLKQ